MPGVNSIKRIRHALAPVDYANSAELFYSDCRRRPATHRRQRRSIDKPRRTGIARHFKDLGGGRAIPLNDIETIRTVAQVGEYLRDLMARQVGC